MRDLIAHLRILVNPKDGIAWDRVLQLVGKIGAKTADKIFQEIAQAPRETPSILKSHSRKFTGLKQLIASMEKASKTLSSGAGAPIRVMLKYYRPFLKENLRNPQERYEDLVALCDRAEKYRSLQKFLNYFTVVLSKSEKDTHKSNKDSVTLSTIHSAKGLEWRVVYLIDLDDSTLPIRYAHGKDQQLEEEQRVLYVGVTRARKRLYLSYHGLLSRFLQPANVEATYRTKQPK